MPEISVIIPTYNVERYIDICLNTLIFQSFSDFEVLCIDDCSTDKTLHVIEKYTQFDKRVKIVSNTHKGGPDVLRGIGIRNAQSPYCVFVDADDVVSPYMLEKYLNNIKINDSDYMYGASISFNRKTRHNQKHSQLQENVFLDIVHGNTFNAENTPGFFPFFLNSEFWGKIFRTEFIKDATFKPDSMIQDIVFCMKCFFKAKKISYLLEPLYVYNYQREGAISANFNEKWLGIFSSLDEMRQIIEKTGMYDKYKNAYIDFKISRIWFYLLKARPECQKVFFEYAKAAFAKEDFSKYDLNTLYNNKFYFHTLVLLHSNFEEFQAHYNLVGSLNEKQ